MDELSRIITKFLQEFLPKTPPTPPGPSPKIVRDAVWGMISLRPHEVALIDTPLFQRLRGIFQTGFTYFVYPCAVHSRFEHSLGCLHLTSRVIRAINDSSEVKITPEEEETLRLAAMLHDIAHCIFSHVSESIYEKDPRLLAAGEKLKRSFPPEDRQKYVGAGEVLAYRIITSKRFVHYFKSLVNVCGTGKTIRLENVARLIVGLPPIEHQDRLYLPQIVNGPFDVDKLDYQTRDGHFTGITFPVDVDRLLASVCIVKDSDHRRFLAVDHRGVAAIEQMLFNRMLLYDAVYHHHKVRSAVKLFQRGISRATLKLEWLLGHDEYDFFGERATPKALGNIISRLRRRDLPHRALVFHRTTINADDTKWHKMIMKVHMPDEDDRRAAKNWLEGIEQRIRESLPSKSGELFLDVPRPPEFQSLQRGTYIKMTDGTKMVLDDLFPITSTVNSYAQQCKYRAYLFAPREKREVVAAAAYKILLKEEVPLNEEAFRLARLDPSKIEKIVKRKIPKAR